MTKDLDAHGRMHIMQQELKSCPFCGDYDAAVSKHDNAWRARCPMCGASTGWRATEKLAIDEWNTRSDAALREYHRREKVAREALEMLSKKPIATWYFGEGNKGYYAGWDDAEYAVKQALAQLGEVG